MYYTYVLHSKKDDKLYTGVTKNLKLRFEQHQNGEVESTKYRRPLILIYYEACNMEDDARRREKVLKSYRGKMFIRRRLKSYFTGWIDRSAAAVAAAALLILLYSISLFPYSAEAAARLQMPPNYLVTGSGLVGYWTFDGKDTNWGTNKTNDLSGQGNTGTLTNMSTTTSPVVGKLGQGLKFDGSDDYVNVSNVSFTTSTTWSAWVKKTSNTASATFISATEGGREYTLRNDEGGTKFDFVWAYAGEGWGRIISPSTYPINQWFHVVVTHDTTTLKMYVNGSLVVSGGATTAASLSGINIGRRMYDSAYYFPGTIDEVRIYNRALSAAEVLNLYNTGKAKANVSNAVISNGLVGYWTFDGATTTWSSATAGITGDLSGNFNTGTLTNMSRATSPVIGKIGQGLKFDDLNDHIVIGGGAVFSTTDAFQPYSGCVWINTSVAATSLGDFISQYDAVDATRWEFGMLGTGGRFRYFKGGSNLATSAGAVNDGKWHYVCFTKNSSQAVTLFIDGVTDGTGTDSNAFSNATTRIGGVAQYYGGLIDDVRIYNRALSAGEVAQLYKLGAAKVNKSPTSLLTDGLVGYWTFDGATTTWSSATAGITGDLSGNFNTGTLTNMNRATSPAIGKIGQGLKFDGSNDYVNVGAADVSVPCTMSAWVKLSARNGNTSPIFGTTGGSSYSGFQAEQYLSNAVGITVTGVQDYAFASPGYTVPLNTWTHLVAVVNSSASATLYVNGLTSGTISGASGLVCNRGRIGATAANFGYFPGIMDDVRIYNRALSAAEVLQLYTSPLYLSFSALSTSPTWRFNRQVTQLKAAPSAPL